MIIKKDLSMNIDKSFLFAHHELIILECKSKTPLYQNNTSCNLFILTSSTPERY